MDTSTRKFITSLRLEIKRIKRKIRRRLGRPVSRRSSDVSPTRLESEGPNKATQVVPTGGHTIPTQLEPLPTKSIIPQPQALPLPTSLGLPNEVFPIGPVPGDVSIRVNLPSNPSTPSGLATRSISQSLLSTAGGLPCASSAPSILPTPNISQASVPRNLVSVNISNTTLASSITPAQNIPQPPVSPLATPIAANSLNSSLASLVLPLQSIIQPQTNKASSTSTSASTVPGKVEPSLWTQAYDRLSEEDKNAIPFTDTDKTGYWEKLLEEVNRRREVCYQNRWKFTFRGKDIIIRDVADKVLTWVEKFKSIGDIVIQYDPVHAALPWAGVRLLLQLALSDKESMEVIMVGIERVVRVLVRSAIHEDLYLISKPEVSQSVMEGVAEGLVELYSAVLKFLSSVIRSLDQYTTVRMLGALLSSQEKGSLFNAIGEKESLLEKELGIAEREVQRNHQTSIKEQNNKLMSFLKEMEKPITRIDVRVNLIYEQLEGEKRRKILRWLSEVEYIKHHEKAQEGLLEDTGEWLLNKGSFFEWRSSSASEILWLHGIPGAGKTKLTCMVIDYLKSKSLSECHEPVVYFYCNRNEPQRRDPEVLMQAILKQLSVALPDLPTEVVKEYDQRERQGLAAGSLGFSDSLKKVMLLLDGFHRPTIVIDALDESDPEKRGQLLQALKTIIRSSNSLVKIFVSSRGDIDIKLNLEEVPNLYIDVKDNYGDIERFVIQEVTNSIDDKQLLHGIVPDQLKEHIISTIVGGANGMFQWANLQIKNLYRFKFPEAIEKNLGRLPKTLEDTYS